MIWAVNHCCVGTIKSHCTRKPTKCLGKNKGADQLCSNCTADQRLCFSLLTQIVQYLFYFNPKIMLLACFSSCTCRFVSDLVGNPKCWFSQRQRLIICTNHPDVMKYHLSRLVEKPTMWFPKRSDTNRPVQGQKQARSLKFHI